LFVQQILERHGVALAPGRFFEAPARFRLSLAGGPDALAAGLVCLGDGSSFHRFSTGGGRV
jgi:aspartate/methionine/tyrosine aminotransferase